MIDVWAMPIKLDPNWKGGDYYGGAEPVEGLAQALKVVTLTTVHYLWAEKLHGYKWAEEGKNPGGLDDQPVRHRGCADQVRAGARGGQRCRPFRVDGQGQRALQRRQGRQPHQGQGAVPAGEDRPAVSRRNTRAGPRTSCARRATTSSSTRSTAPTATSTAYSRSARSPTGSRRSWRSNRALTPIS